MERGGERSHLAQGALSWAQLAKGREVGDAPHQILLTEEAERSSKTGDLLMMKCARRG